ncbi:poly-beta-hydroxybutyrate-responsive repressor [Salipaludibacillus sp. CUR1]|jgi:PadR family transcriptional regulator, regulatory protein PadR|uniref:Poly-beta-hydroxybutyrate-responsive repressor n=1 Tax=Salipaludibacillus aurantiacus TaxID=1601833 RepID=A0A1H9WWE8_9BACI|nr:MULTISPECIES: poly-beta-hydroxybutyrate-responsive repressor [Salipaludibacillus]MCE7793066.1 poly-beta-hydroxybutyrate-responsive repressor [Salipaludibacillus sp. CUR1]SES37733.1 poly-beta-hydroxybutyrate-responsive repressor [Salipaludibacillus aurantiacus]
MTPKNGKDKPKTEPIAKAQKNFIIPVLLLLLKDWNAHGYELMQKLTMFGFEYVDQGNFYRILRQLEKDELVVSEWDTSTSGPAKRIYSITSAGEQYLDLWANSLGQYQKMLDQFFNMYSNFFVPPGFTSKKDDKKDE